MCYEWEHINIFQNIKYVLKYVKLKPKNKSIYFLYYILRFTFDCLIDIMVNYFFVFCDVDV